MGRDRQKYEEKIERSPLFSLEQGTSAYERELYNMEEYLYRYLMAVNETKYGPWGCEIVETSIRCIRSYDPEQGVFLHYFNRAWKNTYRQLLAEQGDEERLHGLKISKEDRRNVRKYLRLLEATGVSPENAGVHRKLAQAMDIPVQKLRDIMLMSAVSVLEDDRSQETGGVLELLADGIPIEQQLLSEEEVQSLLAAVEAVFKGLQERQKPLLSELLTARICPVLPEACLSDRFSFMDAELVKTYARTGTVPTQESLARKYGRDAASISRTINQFLKKLRTQLGEVTISS